MKLFKSFVLPVVGLLLSAGLASCSSSNAANKEIENVDLVPVTTSKNGKWSMINEDGDIVYDAEFKNMPTASYNGLFSVEEGKGYTVYKVGGKIPEQVRDLENLKSVGYLEDGLMPVTFPGKRIALVDEDGNAKFELNPIKGSEIISCAPGYSDGLLLVKTEDGKYGFVDTNGKVVVNPEYEEAYNFSEELALVVMRDKSYNKLWSVIDKSGKVKFKIKDGYDLLSRFYKEGYIVARKDDRIFMINEKGVETKLSSKVENVYDYNDKFIIFSDEVNGVGVIDFNGEIIIRPKYNEIIFSNDGDFLVKKDVVQKEYAKINTNGDEIGDIIDFELIKSFGKFGYFVKEGKTKVLVSDDFERKGKEEFYEVNLEIDRGLISSDYIDVDEIAEIMVKMINGDRVGNLQLGSSASEIMQGKSLEDYFYRSRVEFETLSIGGFRYQIKVYGDFSACLGDFDSDIYSRRFYWNPSSKLYGVDIIVATESDWGISGMNAMKRSLGSDGYKLIKEGLYFGKKAAVYKKDNVIVFIGGEKISGGLVVMKADMENIVLSMIEPDDGKSRVVTGGEYGEGPDNDGLIYSDSDSVVEAVPREVAPAAW